MKQKRLLIGVNGSMLDDQPSGVGVYSFNVINNLSDIYSKNQSPKLTVFTPTPSLLNKNLDIVKLSVLLQSSKYGKLAALSRFLWNTFYYPIQARQYDLLLSPTTHGSFLLRNQIITIHDLLSLRYNNISFHQRIYFKYLLPQLVSKAKLIVTVSETTKKDIIQFLKCPESKIKVVYNGYEHTRYFMVREKTSIILGKHGVKDYLLAVGPTYPHKNFERLLDAYKNLPPAAKQNHPLVIAGGKRKYEAHLKQYVKKIGLENEVHFLGYAPIELMPSLYREAIALVFPSLYEGFGIPLLEAMACGCPILSSNVSSMPEVCGDAALYFDPLNTTAITEAMEAVIKDEDLRNTLKQKGLAQCSKFSWQQTAVSLKQIIENQFSTHNS
jgi:glycosyltransferase involved in cell wall biosynthesis